MSAADQSNKCHQTHTTMQSRQSQEFYMHPRISKKTIFPSYILLPVIEAPLESPLPYSSSGWIPFCNKASWDLSQK
jgi:hypothetical protein